MAAEGELVNGCTFTTQVKNADFWVRNTTVVTGFRVRLVLTIAVAASGTATHLDLKFLGV